MRRKTVFLIISFVLFVIVLSQILLTKTLDIASFTQFTGTSKYDNTESIVIPHTTDTTAKPKLREISAEATSLQINNNIQQVEEISLIDLVGSKVNKADVEFVKTSTTLFKDYAVSKTIENEGKYIVSSKRNGKYQIGGKKTALVIPTKDRANDLLKTFDRLSMVLQKSKYVIDIFISQDGKDSLTQTTIEHISKKATKDLPFCQLTILENKPRADLDSGYLLQSAHYFFIIEEVMKLKYDQLILLEDDMYISDDFFSYMSAGSVLLQNDPSLYCVSAVNDNGQAPFIQDPTLLYRSDYFASGSYLITSQLWSEINSLWKLQFWMHWIRSDDVRKGRACIRPEISRAVTFDEVGINSHSFYWEKQKEVVLNSETVDFSPVNLSYLEKSNFDMFWEKAIHEAVLIKDFDELIMIPVNKYVKILYSKTPGSRSLYAIASELGIMVDRAAKVPRTAYMGVVSVVYRGFRLFIVPEDGPSFEY